MEARARSFIPAAVERSLQPPRISVIEERHEPAVQLPEIDLRRDLERRMHAEQADADIDHVHVLTGEPRGDGATAIARIVSVRLPTHFLSIEQAADLRKELGVGFAPGAVLLDHHPIAET